MKCWQHDERTRARADRIFSVHASLRASMPHISICAVYIIVQLYAMLQRAAGSW